MALKNAIPLDPAGAAESATAPGDPQNLQLLVEAQIARTPAAPALVAGSELLTYDQLNRRANRVAHGLRRLGVGPEAVVGVLMERSVEMVVALLGAVKAGAAYLPLDPTYPVERLAFMLSDAGAAAVLAQEEWRDRIPAGAISVLPLDGPRPWAADGDDRNPPCLTLPANAVYVIYTSGSTGRPKGVVNTHGALCNRLLWGQSTFHLGPGDRVLQKTPFTFDVSVWEIFWTLAAGARIVMAHPGGHRDNAYLIGAIREHGITTLQFVPSMLSLFLASDEVASCRSLRRVITGGEALTPDLVERFFSRSPAELHNLYGPTEAAIEVSAWHCERGDETLRRTVPIGRPIANVRFHLHDGNMNPVPPQSPGELLIGGVALARGYLRRPDLTAERFIPDPWSGEPGGRLYRTGDLARLRDDGVVEYLGRLDHQVKVRGFRVELGEIEAAMRRFPGVSAAVVAAPADGAGVQRLVAYFVMTPETPPPAVEEWKRFLARILPDYMIPSVFVSLEALPLNPHGKVDRSSLPSPDGGRPELEAAFVAPRSDMELTLAGLWEELLHVDHVGVHDSFFDLGGHSLLVAQALARIRQRLGVELPVTELFSHPTLGELAAAVERAARGALPPDLAAPPPLRPVPRDGRPLPLSFAQERIWFLDQLEPGGNLAYNFQAVLWLRGPLRVDLLALALSEIVRRHEVLRTRFPTIDGQPRQIVEPAETVRLPLIDLFHLPAAVRGRETERLIAELVAVPFDIAQGGLMRWRLLRLAGDKHALVQVEHHFVHDGWSFAILLRELAALYIAFSRSEPSPLPELPVQYADYAVWQRQWLSGEVMERLLAFWKGQLAGAPPALEIATDRPRPAAGSFRGDVLPLPVDPNLYAGLRRFGRRQGFTLYMTMLGGFLALLHRYTGEEDLVIGTSNANRRTRELEGIVGMMVNSLVLRADLTGGPDFQTVLERARALALEVYAHQDMPLDRLVRELRIERRPGRNPLFQVMFNFHDAPVPDSRFADLEMSPELRANRTAKLDLNLIVVPRAEQRVGRREDAEDRQATIRWEYNTDLFDATTIHRLSDQYQRLLAGAVASPDLLLAELPLLSAAELVQVLTAWNDTRADYPRDATIHDLFAAWVEWAPDAVALTFGDESLTYRELDDRSNRMAHHLRALGVHPGEVVALAAERSLDLVPALLGILKSGAAYLPLDPSHPAERRTWMLADAGARLLVCEERLAGDLPVDNLKLVRLDADREEIGRAPVAALPRLAGGGDLAYVMYTSGSTGRPKGVEITHRSVVRLVHGGFARLGSGEVILQLAPISFDASTFEIWGTLLTGCRLAVFPAGMPSLAAVGAEIARAGVTAVWLTAGLFHQMVDDNLEGLRPLRQLLAGGDVLSPEHVRRALTGVPGLTLINGYGPTEGTTFTCCHAMTSAEAGDPVPIGRPIAGTRVYIVGLQGEPMPVGAPGELLAGGDGLALGYLDRPDLTAERFVPDPFGGEAGGRLYRTGDLARWRPDGTIEFLGRFDHQVKIRGFRVELGEIEAALASHPGVAAAVAIYGDIDGLERLVAYVVPRGSEGVAPDELRRHIERLLPAYAVPSALVPLSALPLTANGKIDRRALPAPERRPATAMAPRTDLERHLARLWREILAQPQVGLDDNFFDLGGHSLLLARIHAQLQKDLARTIPIVDLFRHPTIRSLAGHLEEEPSGDPDLVRSSLAAQQTRAGSAARRRELRRERRGAGNVQEGSR